MNQTGPQTLKGFRDFLPEQLRVRNYVKNICIKVFEKFGFEPLETPTLEYATTLMGKYGQEADKLIYKFMDNGQREVGLRYDLTVPTSKVLAIYRPQLPFKRYQIQPVWRAEKPQKGRYREFLQCDIDTFGSSTPTSDAEVVAVIYNILELLNFKKYQIRINSRQVLYTIIDQCGIKEDTKTILQSVDKLQKIGEKGVKKELVSKGISVSQITTLFKYIKKAQPDDYLKSLFGQLEAFGVPKTAYVFDPTMVRGLDYYTGPIFETYVEEPKIGSITGGGRYDKLVQVLGGPDVPAVGTTIGLDRIVDCIIELKLLPDLSPTLTTIMVSNFGGDTEIESISLSAFLRKNGLNTYLYPNADKLGKQFAFASAKGIPYVAVIGSDEIKANKITLKNMVKKEQVLVTRKELLKLLVI